MIDPPEIYCNLPRLETERLVLRKLALSDLEDVFAYSSDEAVTRHLRWGPHETLAQTERYLREVLEEYREGRDGPWGIEYKETGKVVGAIHLFSIQSQHKKAEIGMVLSRDYWRRGLASEALDRVLRFVFEDVRLNRIEAYCLVENRAGERVMERAGMQREGVLREYLYQKGALRDFSVYAMLRREYNP
jgi:ribosomal-protein-alanine N-acetyltransferase